MSRVYSKKLTAPQNAAFEKYENLTSCPPFGVSEFESGAISAADLWNKNVAWIVEAAGDAQRIQFPA